LFLLVIGAGPIPAWCLQHGTARVAPGWRGASGARSRHQRLGRRSRFTACPARP